MTQSNRVYRLLMVDDDELDRRHLVRLLELQAPGRCEIEHAVDGTSGLAAMSARNYDCVLLDYDLPDMSGLKFLGQAVESGELPCVVVLVTGHGSEAIAIEAKNLGAQDYLVKDQLDQGSLWRAVKQAITERELHVRLAGTLADLTAANAALEAEACTRMTVENALRAAKEVAEQATRDFTVANTALEEEAHIRTAVEVALRAAKEIAEQATRDFTVANAALEEEARIRMAIEVALRATKEAAEEANRAKTRFVAMVTHELRTPLNGILGYAQLLRIEGGLTDQQDARVDAMMTAGRHLLDMIERVLDFASIETGKMELHPVAVSVHDLAEGCIAFIGPMATEHTLGLRLASSHDAPRMIMADPSRLRQVLLNLLGNAVKYTESGSVELRMLAGSTPGGLRIEVIDTGPGISDEAKKRLFQDFERMEASASVEGTGLGLAISARIVGLMGGKIGYQDAPAGGSIFWLDLPSAEIVVVAPPEAKMPAHPISGIRVLLVDDIAMNRDVIGAFLRAAGHEVLLAEGGQEAVRLAFEQNFDLILMDVRMPEMDGLEATRHIRKLPPPRGQAPVLALTANSFPEQIAQCREAGMDGHVAKPVDYATLMEAIADTIARAPSCWTEDFPVTAPPEAVAPAVPRFDRAVLDQTLEFMWPAEIVPNLHLLHARQEQMLLALDERAAPAVLADNAHALASAAGMFGFAALSAVGRRFERAVALDLPETEFLTVQLRTETSVALATLEGLLREDRIRHA